MLDAPLYFGDVRIDPDESRVYHRGRPVHLPPRAFSLLSYFASHPRRLLAKDEILDAVWPDQHVTEGVLKVTVRQLRQALHDDARSPWLIATVARRGYRFLPEVRRADLPYPLTSFVGRRSELAELADRIRGKGLTTLVGAGGSGKTRLALEAARAAAGAFDRVAWIELAGTRDPELVPHRLAAELGVREHAGVDLVDALGAACRSRQVLLVLDNCEHLVTAVAGLVQRLLDLAMPAVAVLATSREPLAVAGERIVHTTPFPPAPAGASREEILSSDAARLFCDRARLAAPGVAPDAELVARICRRLDGLPLAIELAAARLRLLSLEQIASRLDEALDFLAAGDRSAPERHRTLRGTVEWSLRLLDSEERRLLEILGVFAGSFTLEAAEAVAGSDEIPRGAVLGILDRLVAKSVVEVRRGGGASRFFLLETIRQALPKADGAVRERHLRFYRDLALEAAPFLAGGRRTSWTLRLADEADDFRAALAFSRESAERREAGLEIAGSLVWFWFFQGSWGEGRRHLRSLIGDEPLGRPLAKALFGLGFLDFAGGDLDAAEDRWQRCASPAGRDADPVSAALASSFLSQIALARPGDPDVPLRLAERALGVLAGGGEPWERAMVFTNAGNVRRDRREDDAALAAYEAAEEALRGSPDPWLEAMLLRNRGMVAANTGRDEDAAALFRRSLTTLREAPEPWFLSRGLDELAAVEGRRGRARLAARLFGAAESLRTRIGAPVVPMYRRSLEAAVAAARRALPEEDFRQAWDDGKRLSTDAVLAEAADQAAASDS